MKFSLIFLSTFLLFSGLCTAQKVEETKDRAKQKAENRLDRKIDKGLDSGLDAIEGLFSRKKKKKDDEPEEENQRSEKAASNESESAATSAMMKMLGGGADVDVEDVYGFDQSFDILIETFDKKGRAEEATEMTFLVKTGTSRMGIKTTQEGVYTEMVYDMGSYEIISLVNTDGQKIGTTMTLDKDQIDQGIADATPEEGEMPSFTKTGKSKTISGYHCDEYLVENNEDINATYWITTEAEADWVSSMAGMSGVNQGMPSFGSMAGYPEDGAVIQMITSEKNGEKMIMTVQDINTDGDFSIRTEGYTFMNLGGSR